MSTVRFTIDMHSLEVTQLTSSPIVKIKREVSLMYPTLKAFNKQCSYEWLVFYLELDIFTLLKGKLRNNCIHSEF